MLRRFFRKKQPSSEKLESIVKKSVRKGAKDVLTGNDSLSFEGKQKFVKQEINEIAHSIIKDAVKKPEILLDYIKSHGTVIVKSRFMKQILFFFNEEEGFITPMKGIKALLFTLVINIFSPIKLNTGFKTPVMFALNNKPVNIYTLAHQFHLWLSYVKNLPGFEEETMKNFKHYWKAGPNAKDVSFLTVDEIFCLKDIIARELEALKFVKELGQEFEGSKQKFKDIQDGNGVSM